MNKVLSAAGFAGRYHFEIVRGGKVVDAWDDSNLIPDEGLNHILNVTMIPATVRAAGWYIALTSGVHTPAAADTAATIVAAATEFTGYAEATRVAIVAPAATAKAITNSASKATFTINAPVTLNGAFVSDVSTKSATTGALLSSLALLTPRALIAGDQVVVTFTLTAASV